MSGNVSFVRVSELLDVQGCFGEAVAVHLWPSCSHTSPLLPTEAGVAPQKQGAIGASSEEAPVQVESRSWHPQPGWTGWCGDRGYK